MPSTGFEPAIVTNESKLKFDALNLSANLTNDDLFCRSSTGKSTLIKRALSQIEPTVRVYLFNVRSDEVEGYQKFHPKVESVEAASLGAGLRSAQSGSVVILEDVISLKKKDEESLRLLLNYKAHHDRLRVFCVGHMLFRNSLLTLVPLFNYIVFTLNNASRSLVRQAATYAFNLDAESRVKWVDRFSKCCLSAVERGRSFCFVDCSTVRFYLFDCAEQRASLLSGTDGDDDDDDDVVGGASEMARSSNFRSIDGDVDDENKLEGGKTKKRSVAKNPLLSLEDRFASCFPDREFASQTKGLFSILSQTLRNEISFRESDLSFVFAQSRKPGVVKRVSVVDYIEHLLNKSPSRRPPTEHLVLHRYLSERCKIPKLFVRNRYFISDSLQSSNDELDDDDDDVDDDDSSSVGKRKRSA